MRTLYCSRTIRPSGPPALPLAGGAGLDRRGAELLFQVLTEREEKNSMAIATDESFSSWTKTFTTPGSARRSWTGSPSAATSSRPAQTPTGSLPRGHAPGSSGRPDPPARLRTASPVVQAPMPPRTRWRQRVCQSPAQKLTIQPVDDRSQISASLRRQRDQSRLKRVTRRDHVAARAVRPREIQHSPRGLEESTKYHDRIEKQHQAIGSRPPAESPPPASRGRGH